MILNIIFIFISILIITFSIGHLFFTRALKNAEWYDDVVFQYKSEDCTHLKSVKLSDTNWKTNFTIKRIKKKYEEKDIPIYQRFRQESRLSCEKCGEKHWFHIDNRKEIFSTVTELRLEYLLRTIVAFFLISLVAVFAIDYFL